MFFPESFPPDILLEIRSYPGNDHCCDCSSLDTDWCSISHGTLICLECAGKHRSLGVLVSFVRSISMDSWSRQQVEMMRQGGNEQIKRFFRKLEIENSPVKTLYCSKGANHYRERLKEKVGKIMSGELKSESRVVPHSSRHRNTRSQSAIAELMLNGAKSEPGSLNGEKRKSSFEQYHVSFGEGPMGMTISKDFGGRALVSKLVTGGPAERSGVGIGDHISGVAKKRLDDYDEIMHMIPCLARPIAIQFTRRVESHHHIHANGTNGAHLVIEPSSPGMNRSMHGSKSMANMNMALNLSKLDQHRASGSHKSKARIRTPRDGLALGHIAETPDDEGEDELAQYVRSPETSARLASYRTRSKDQDSPTKLNFSDASPMTQASSAEFSQTDQAANPPVLSLPKHLRSIRPEAAEESADTAVMQDDQTTSSHQSSPLFIDLSSENATPAPPTPVAPAATPIGSTADSIDAKSTHAQSLDLCKQIDELLEGGFGGRLSLEVGSASMDSPMPTGRGVSRHSSRQEVVVESPESDRLSNQHVLFSGEGLSRKLTLHTLQNGTPIKVLRSDKWKSATLRRKHRDGSFKVTFRDGSVEAHVSLQRLAMTTDTLRALSDWHTCTSAVDEAHSDEQIAAAYRSVSGEDDPPQFGRLSHGLGDLNNTDPQEVFSSPDSSSYAGRSSRVHSGSVVSVHSFRNEDLASRSFGELACPEDFVVLGSREELDSWIASELSEVVAVLAEGELEGEGELGQSDLDRDRASSFDSVISDGRTSTRSANNNNPQGSQKVSPNNSGSSTFAASDFILLSVTYYEAPLGLRLSTNRSATNSPKAGHTAVSGAAPDRQPEITKVVPGGRSELEGVQVGDVLVQIEEHRIVDYAHAMRILQECTYPISLQFKRSAANIVNSSNTQSTKSIVDELMGVQTTPLSRSPPQLRRLASKRISVPTLELSAAPEASPARPPVSRDARVSHSAAVPVLPLGVKTGTFEPARVSSARSEASGVESS